MKFHRIAIIIAVILLIATSTDLLAQGCSQCRMVPGTDLNGGNGIGRGINNGVLYLLGIPYIFFMAIAIIYRKKLKELFNRLRTRNY
jgi:hypothetical protein